MLKFLVNNIEPLPNHIYGSGYRASVTLKDGTFLPCVIFRNPQKITDLAMKRFDEEKSGKGLFNMPPEDAYRKAVESFVAKGNRLSLHDIAEITGSKNAFPVSILKQIKGETSMGWTGFVVKMKDGNCFGYGTQLTAEFFDLPGGYAAGDIEEIINDSYVNNRGEVKSNNGKADDYDASIILREKPYFECFVEGLI